MVDYGIGYIKFDYNQDCGAGTDEAQRAVRLYIPAPEGFLSGTEQGRNGATYSIWQRYGAVGDEIQACIKVFHVGFPPVLYENSKRAFKSFREHLRAFESS